MTTEENSEQLAADVRDAVLKAIRYAANGVSSTNLTPVGRGQLAKDTAQAYAFVMGASPSPESDGPNVY